jgi:hypothetical protein
MGTFEKTHEYKYTIDKNKTLFINFAQRLTIFLNNYSFIKYILK